MVRLEIPLDYSTAHATALGRLVGHWVTVEVIIEDFMALLLETGSFKGHVVSRSIISFNGRLNILRRLVINFVDPGWEKDLLLKLLQEAQDLNTKRNVYVHSIWAVSPDKNKLTMVRTVLPPKPKHLYHPDKEIAASDIDSVREEISEFAAKLQGWYNRFSATLSIRSLPLDEPPEQENSPQDQGS